MIILCYHELSDEESTIWRLKPQTFRRHLDLIQAMPVRPRITFDDGCAGCMAAHETLIERGLSATFYICPGFIDGTAKQKDTALRYLTWADIRELSTLHAIGAHSMTHPIFDHLPFDARRHEMHQSKLIIEQKIGMECVDFATPFGYSDLALEWMASAMGFKTLATTYKGRNDPLHPFRLERWEVHSPCPAEEFAGWLESIS